MVGEITFDNVEFSYDEGPAVLSGLSLQICPGETVALVGVSGSGKSTVANLVSCPHLDVAAGAVPVDPHHVRDVTLASLRRQIAVVFEECFLFSESVRANIAYGKPDATAEQVEAAARAAEAHEFIAELPFRGYDTVVGESGTTLSGVSATALSLTARQGQSPLSPDDGVVTARRQLRNELMPLGRSCGRLNLLSGCVGLAVGDVRPDGFGEEEALFEHDADLALKRGERHVAHVVAV